MTTPLRPMHLVERAAARLQNGQRISLADPPLLPPEAPDAWTKPTAPPPAPPAGERPAPPVADRPTVERSGLAPPPLEERPVVPVLDRATLERAGLVVGLQRSRITEEFRVGATRLLREMRTDAGARAGRAQMILITSTQPAEGKTFTALNLAATLANGTTSGVLLVDVDNKAKSLSYHLGLAGRPGLADVAARPELQMATLLVPTAVHNLAVLPVGQQAGGQHAEGWSEDRSHPLSAVVERLARQFRDHLIILDASPCLATSDPTVLAPLVRQIVMVVEAGRTNRTELLAALDMLKGCPNVALLLNKASLGTPHTFGAYHYQGKYY